MTSVKDRIEAAKAETLSIEADIRAGRSDRGSQRARLISLARQVAMLTEDQRKAPGGRK